MGVLAIVYSLSQCYLHISIFDIVYFTYCNHAYYLMCVTRSDLDLVINHILSYFHSNWSTQILYLLIQKHTVVQKSPIPFKRTLVQKFKVQKYNKHVRKYVRSLNTHSSGLTYFWGAIETLLDTYTNDLWEWPFNFRGKGVCFFLITKLSSNFREKIIDKKDAKIKKSDGAIFRREMFGKMTKKNTDILVPRNNKPWVSDYCLTPNQQFFSYIMARTSLHFWWDDDEVRFALYQNA